MLFYIEYGCSQTNKALIVDADAKDKNNALNYETDKIRKMTFDEYGVYKLYG